MNNKEKLTSNLKYLVVKKKRKKERKKNLRISTKNDNNTGLNDRNLIDAIRIEKRSRWLTSGFEK